MNPSHKFWLTKISNALEGSSSAGFGCLLALRDLIQRDQLKSVHPIYEYISNCIWEHAQGVPLDRAFNLEEEPHVGGRPRKYNEHEVIAADVLLRRECSYRPEEANDWLAEKIGIDQRSIQRFRKKFRINARSNMFDSNIESLDSDFLFHSSGSLRQYLKEVLPQINQ